MVGMRGEGVAKNDHKQYKRQNMRHMLALAWLKTHRMDVYDAIQAEIEKKFPNQRAPVKTVLPDTLKRLK